MPLQSSSALKPLHCSYCRHCPPAGPSQPTPSAHFEIDSHFDAVHDLFEARPRLCLYVRDYI